MCEIVCRINPPFVFSSMMRAFQDAICRQIPHLRISILEVLLHAEIGLLGFIFAILHVLELDQRFFDWPVSVETRPWLVLLLASIDFNFLLCNFMINERFELQIDRITYECSGKRKPCPV